MKIWSFRNSIAFLTLLISLFSCKKGSEKKYCWQAYNPSGADVTGLILCDKTEAQVQEAYPQFWFYKEGEQKFCWKVQTGSTFSYWVNIPVSMMNKHESFTPGLLISKIDCSSFCHLTWHEKSRSKVTGLYNPTKLIGETLFSSDSCSKLSIGQIIVVRETSDSIFTRELKEKNPW